LKTYEDFTIKTVSFEGDKLVVLDQSFLPGHVQYETIETFEKGCVAIKEMTIRGAPLIGIVAAYTFVLGLNEGDLSVDDLREKLLKTRPTAINLKKAVDRVISKINATIGSEATYRTALGEAHEIKREEYDACIMMGNHGADWIEKKLNFLLEEKDRELIIQTHCNAGSLATYGTGTALAVVRELHKRGHKVKVYCNETRPRCQGKLTYWELDQHGIPVVFQVDNQAGINIFNGHTDIVIFGADRITKRGSVFNKIGSSLLASMAQNFGTPVMVVAPLSTLDEEIDSPWDVEIEERPAVEVTENNWNVLNQGFDITDPSMISTIITEVGDLFSSNRKEKYGFPRLDSERDQAQTSVTNIGKS